MFVCFFCKNAGDGPVGMSCKIAGINTLARYLIYLAKSRVNPRPIGRGYKREPRSGSTQAWPDSERTRVESQWSPLRRYMRSMSVTTPPHFYSAVVCAC